MTAKDVLTQDPYGFGFPNPKMGRRSERTDGARNEYYFSYTYERWRKLPEKLVIRRINLRTHNRRWRRRVGLDLRGA